MSPASVTAPAAILVVWIVVVNDAARLDVVVIIAGDGDASGGDVQVVMEGDGGS